MIDLHTHTTASDGSYSPTELVQLAQQVGLEALAITDHDTLAGLAQARLAANQTKLELINGVELACRVTVGTLHMLGYFIDPDNQPLQDLLDCLVNSRQKRNPRILAKLNKLGYEITMAQVQAQAKGPIISRLHIALVMLEKKYVRSIDEAFGRFLGDKGSANVRRIEPEPSDAIRLIHQAGGLAVVAHPVHLRAANEPELTKKLKDLADLGLDGVEVWYPEHTAQMTEQLWRICQRLDLATVGGSDFHGSAKTHIKLGVGRGSLNIPLEILNRLKSRL